MNTYISATLDKSSIIAFLIYILYLLYKIFRLESMMV